MRKENDVADARAIREQHHEPVDADSTAPGRRQAILKGPDVIGVVEHRLFVARVLGLDLCGKAGGLIFGIVELGKPVGNFAPRNEELKTLGDPGAGIRFAG